MDEVAAIGFALALAGAGFLLAIVLPIASFVTVRRVRADARRLQARLDALESTVRRIEVRFDRQTTGAPPAPTLERAPEVRREAPVPPPEPSPSRPLTGRTAAAPLGNEAAALVGPANVGTKETAPPIAAAHPQQDRGPEQATDRLVARDSEGPADTLESRIGGRGLLYVGAIALLMGLGFFVKYAFDNEWITPTARVVLGGLAGLGLVAAGWSLDRRSYRQYGQILAGTGFVALYISTFAAIAFYGLIAQATAFGLMVVITGASAFMADRLGSHGLAVVAVLGGFATPFLVGGDEDAQITLLTYDAILVAGTIFLARRRHWPSLNLISYGLTFLTFIAWGSAHYTPDKWVTTQVFLVVFCAQFLFAWSLLRRGVPRTAEGELRADGAVDTVSQALLSAPVVFHVASLVNLAPHALPYVVYLLLFTLAGVLAGVRAALPSLRMAVFVAAVPLLIFWIADHHAPEWHVASFVGILAAYLMHLGGLWEWLTRRPDDELTRADVALLHANGLALAGGVYAVTWDWPLAWTVGLALVQAAWHALLAYATRRGRRDVAPNELALMFALVGLAIGLAWDGWPAIVAWMAEAGAIVWVGLRTRQVWLRAGGIGLTAWMLLVTIGNDFFATSAGFRFLLNDRVGAVAALIAILYVVAALYRRAEPDLPHEAPGMRAAYLTAANVMTVLVLSAEIHSYWHARAGFDAAANLALQASLSLVWAVYGTGLIVAGIMRRYRPIRYLAIGLLSLTVVKVFLSDLYQLGGIYRIAGFLGLGVFLLVGAWLYQRYREIIVGKSHPE